MYFLPVPFSWTSLYCTLQTLYTCIYYICMYVFMYKIYANICMHTCPSVNRLVACLRRALFSPWGKWLMLSCCHFPVIATCLLTAPSSPPTAARRTWHLFHWNCQHGAEHRNNNNTKLYCIITTTATNGTIQAPLPPHTHTYICGICRMTNTIQ